VKNDKFGKKVEKLKNHWYLICPLEDIKDHMISKTILGEKIIIFKDEKQNIAALEDRCCHRNVQLSLGYLDQGIAVCGYHGWQYNGEGYCVKIPSQLPENKIPPTARLKSYPLRVVNNWVWIFIGDEKLAGQTEPLDIPEMGQWDFTYRSHIFKGDLESVAESLIDPYHIAFTHRHSIGSFMGQIEEFPADFNLTIVEDGLEGSYSRANRGSLAEKMYFGRTKNITAKIRFYYPNMSRLQVEFSKRTLLILEHVMAVDNDHVEMMQITLWHNIFSVFPPFARFFMARKSNKIVNEDIVLLESQLDIIKSRNGDYRDISVKGDEVSLAFRKFWRRKMDKSSNRHS
jgi:phenylpropionate dioxygenase-like ring-hydroxylating dioxygenase large terminal subunit